MTQARACDREEKTFQKLFFSRRKMEINRTSKVHFRTGGGFIFSAFYDFQRRMIGNYWISFTF